MGTIIIYRITIIPYTLDKVANFMKLRIVEDWLTKLGVNWPVMLKYYLCFFQLIQYVLHIAEWIIIMQDIRSHYCKIKNSTSTLNGLMGVMNQSRHSSHN